MTTKLILTTKSAEDVHIEPTAEMMHWSIYEVDFLDELKVHLLTGFVIGKKWRVTTEIKTFDPKKKTIVTSSSRIYSLIGQPKNNTKGIIVWQLWKSVNNVVSDVDITDQYAKQIKTLVM